MRIEVIGMTSKETSDVLEAAAGEVGRESRETKGCGSKVIAIVCTDNASLL